MLTNRVLVWLRAVIRMTVHTWSTARHYTMRGALSRELPGKECRNRYASTSSWSATGRATSIDPVGRVRRAIRLDGMR